MATGDDSLASQLTSVEEPAAAADSPAQGAETPEGRDDSEHERPKPSQKRKHRESPPLSTTPTRSPAPVHIDSSTLSTPPVLLPTTAHLPPSEFEFYTTRSHPINKNNYRYTPCGPSSSSAHLPVLIQRTIESPPQAARFSWEDRSSFVLVTEDAKTITAEKGWRAAKANVGVREGNWYWEVKVERGGGEGGRQTGGEGEGSWARVGVGRREAPVNAPVGFDGYSYAYRDRGGDAVTLARSQPYGAPYGSGSTIGIYISLPPRPTPSLQDRRDPARIVRKRIPIRYKGQLYFESLEYTQSKEMEDLSVDPATKAKLVVAEAKAAPGTKSRPAVADLTPPPRPLPTLPQSRIAFFLDGVCQGVAFEDLYDFLPLRLHPGARERKKGADVHLKLMENWNDDGATGYFPFVSVFGGAIATLNPGPHFAFPPPDDLEAVLASSPRPPSSPAITFDPPRAEAWRPLCERYPEFLAEQARLDALDEREAIKVFEEAQRVEGGAAMKRGRSGEGALAPGRLAQLGVLLRKEEEKSWSGGLGEEMEVDGKDD